MLARFLVGVLVFAGYAQQTGAPHVLAPRRSRLVAAAGIRADRADSSVEAEVYEQVRRRLRDAGSGWREGDLPWTPSFLPFLLARMNPVREGPDILLERAKELRSSNAVQRYRELREALMSEDAERSAEAIEELTAAADEMTQALGSNRQELELTRNVFVEVLPKALGVGVGAAAGTSPPVRSARSSAALPGWSARRRSNRYSAGYGAGFSTASHSAALENC